MINEKDLNSAELETMSTLRSLITFHGEVQMHEEATIHIKELEKFLIMKVLEDTQAFSSLGKFCDGNGCSYEWINCQKPHLIKNGFRMQ